MTLVVVWLYDWWSQENILLYIVIVSIIITINEFEIYYRLSVKNTNIRTEPKHIVFLTQLLLLFNLCHTCKADNSTVEASGKWDTGDRETATIQNAIKRTSGTASPRCQV